ncbi:MAG: ABC transporter permease, partial [Eubacterium sp.]|nr:ABC transporter permease [Eubacterium sp.]
IITTLGIGVSVAMITAVFVAVASFLNMFGDIEMTGYGYKHAVLTVNQEQLQELKADDRLERVGVRTSLDSPSYQLENAKSRSSGVGDIYSGDYTNLEQMITGEYEGTIPKNENEIAVEQKFIEKNELDWKVGDTVTLPLGYRYVTQNDEQVVIGGGYYGGEQFEVTDVGEFKITAILHNNPPTMVNYNIVRGFDSDKLNLTDGQTVTATIELKKVNHKSLDVIRDIAKQYDITDYEINDDYLETKFAIDENSVVVTTFIPMGLIVLIIIMIASVVLIYNAFGMSLSERVRYLGMLASVGATRRQKKLSVYYEGFILGAVGIPIGILAGIAGIGITLKAVGQRIISTGMIAGVSDSGMNMKVVVPLWAIIGIVVFSAFTIFISSFIPSHKASRVTPVDAIRQRNEIRIKARKLKSPKIVRAIFGYEGELAYKNLKRNGRKARVITASIALSVILFFSCHYFCYSFVAATNLEAEVPYQVMTIVGYDKKDSFTKELDNISDIDNYYCVNNSYLELSTQTAQESGNSDFLNKEIFTNKYENLLDSRTYVYVNYLDDEDFNQLCADNGIDYKAYYSDTLKGVIMNNINHDNNSSKVFTDKLLGCSLNTFADVQIADFVEYDKDNYVCNLNARSCISVYMPISVYESAVTSDGETDEISYLVGIETEQHEKVAEEVRAILDENDFGGTYVQDYIEALQVMNTLVFIIEVFVYGFIALITLITVANIINTISTGIAMRRKEFAMLKSVGTSPKGFRKMVSLESAFYGIKALIFSIPISVLISFAINKTLASGAIPFEINYTLYAAVILVVFAIIGLTMLYSVSKLKDDSIVETLKEEIN